MRYLKIAAIFVSLGLICWAGVLKMPRKPQIYDCFLFFNELELLEVRLSEMYDHVDRFVLVEATETFRGKPKPLVFAENRHRFEKFADKIIHVVVTERIATENPWKRERFQRQQVMRGLKKCHKNDVIFLSDVDEIVRGDRIQEIARLITSKEEQAVVCNQAMYCGYLNRYLGGWSGTIGLSYDDFKRLPTKITRRLRNRTPRTLRKAQINKIIRVDNAGWHFSSVGGISRYITKLESFSHKKLDTPEIDKAKHFSDTIAPLPIVEIDTSFPRYIYDNRKLFEAIGFIE